MHPRDQLAESPARRYQPGIAAVEQGGHRLAVEPFDQPYVARLARVAVRHGRIAAALARRDRTGSLDARIAQRRRPGVLALELRDVVVAGPVHPEGVAVALARIDPIDGVLAGGDEGGGDGVDVEVADRQGRRLVHLAWRQAYRAPSCAATSANASRNRSACARSNTSGGRIFTWLFNAPAGAVR